MASTDTGDEDFLFRVVRPNTPCRPNKEDWSFTAGQPGNKKIRYRDAIRALAVNEQLHGLLVDTAKKMVLDPVFKLRPGATSLPDSFDKAIHEKILKELAENLKLNSEILRDGRAFWDSGSSANVQTPKPPENGDTATSGEPHVVEEEDELVNYMGQLTIEEGQSGPVGEIISGLG